MIMSKQPYVTTFSYKCDYANEKHYEVNTLPSKTRPDEGYTIKELMARALQGMPIEERPSFFTAGEEDRINDFVTRPIDFTDLDALRTFNTNLDSSLKRAFKAKEEKEKARLAQEAKDQALKEIGDKLVNDKKEPKPKEE